METDSDVVSWRVSPRLAGGKLAAAAVFALITLFLADEPVSRTLAGLATLALILGAVRDFAVPVRLSADAAGITLVSGVAARRRLAWSQVERVRVDARSRLGLRSELLEIDAGDTLHLFSENQLGVPPGDAAAVLERLRDRPR